MMPQSDGRPMDRCVIHPHRRLTPAGKCSICDSDLANPVVGSVDATLAERGNRYGDFSNHAVIAQDLMDVMRAAKGTPIQTHSDPLAQRTGWERLDSVKRQALTVIADKIARILSGDPEYGDNWHDIQGYAKLAEDRCKP